MSNENRLRKITACKLCGKKKVKLSRRGYCPDCTIKLIQNAVAQLRVKKGEIYDKWRTNLLKSMED